MTAYDTLAKWYADDKILIFGHRGASAYAPMNTIPAFELAIEQGADGIELDVHLTKDGELIIVHDFTVDHTTDGEGLVAETTLADLKALDAGSWFDLKFSGIRLPTLSDVFEAVGHGCIVNVEIKTLAQETDGTEQAVIDCIRNHDMSEHVIVSSFNPSVLKRFRPLAPDIPLGYLIYPTTVPDISSLVLAPDEYEALHPYHAMIDEAFISYASQSNRFMNSWTINDVNIAKSIVEKGVRGIVTDKPDVMIEALR